MHVQQIKMISGVGWCVKQRSLMVEVLYDMKLNVIDEYTHIAKYLVTYRASHAAGVLITVIMTSPAVCCLSVRPASSAIRGVTFVWM